MSQLIDAELKSLQINRSNRRQDGSSGWASRFIIIGILLFVLAGAATLIYGKLNAVTDVDIARVHATNAGATVGADNVILNATGYIIAAHKIELASKVVGKVAWIGVEKGDKVRPGQVLVRLEDDEYRARLIESEGNLNNLKARLAELEHGSRPEEIARANADVEQARADQANTEVTLRRTKDLVQQGVLSKQALDDAQAKYDSAVARTNSVRRTFDLTKLGPRQEQIDAMRAQVRQAEGTLAYNKTQLDNTVIKAPTAGTILERNVERGEFVTTGFVGDKGAKGYVVSMADLNDLQAELDINESDFAKLGSTQPAVVTTDAYPDRKYRGRIEEISPEANRQKATVQVKVRVQNPDDLLRPDMNATVAFYQAENARSKSVETSPVVTVPASAVRDGSVFVMVDGKAVKRTVKVAGTNAQGVRIEGGLIGGEDVIVNPPADLKEGRRVRSRQTA